MTNSTQQTPEETAASLMESVIEEIDNFTGGQERHTKAFAKRLCLICINQAITHHPFPNNPDERDIRFHEYWEAVREAIKNCKI